MRVASREVVGIYRGLAVQPQLGSGFNINFGALVKIIGLGRRIQDQFKGLVRSRGGQVSGPS